jgi:hypothetical protein
MMIFEVAPLGDCNVRCNLDARTDPQAGARQSRSGRVAPFSPWPAAGHIPKGGLNG